MRQFYHCIWFVGDHRTADWMGSVLRDEGGPWRLEYRFRYYKDDEVHDKSKDVKNWYTLTLKDASEASLQRLVDSTKQTVIPLMELRFGDKAECVLLDCWNDDPKFMFELGSKDWIHLKREPQPQERRAN